MKTLPKAKRYSSAERKFEMLHLYQQAFTAHQQHQLDTAKAIYQTILDTDSEFQPALHMMGVLAAQRYDFQTAITFILKAIKADPNDSRAHYNLANAYIGVGQLEKAIVSYDNSIKISPNYAEALSNRGVALHSLGRYNDAIVSFNKAIQLAPNYVDAYLNKGTALASIGMLVDAEENFRHALKIQPNDSQVLAALSKTLLRQGQHKEGLSIQSAAFGGILFDTKTGVVVKPKLYHAQV